MEDGPGKPDPTGLFEVVQVLTQRHQLSPDLPVLYAGDTVADMQTLVEARSQNPERTWIGVGVLPPHVVAKEGEYRRDYDQWLRAAGAEVVVPAITSLTAAAIRPLLA
jgi:HAD superfamily phosphatase